MFLTSLLDRTIFTFSVLFRFRFTRLSEPTEARRNKLQDSLALQRYLANVEEELAWIRDKEPLVKSDDLGRTLIGTRQNEIHIIANTQTLNS